MYQPRPYALDDNKIPVVVAGLVLFAGPVGVASAAIAGATLLGGYVVGPALAHLIVRLADVAGRNIYEGDIE